MYLIESRVVCSLIKRALLLIVCHYHYGTMNTLYTEILAIKGFTLFDLPNELAGLVTIFTCMTK